jgi:hypothetical protein
MILPLAMKIMELPRVPPGKICPMTGVVLSAERKKMLSGK